MPIPDDRDRCQYWSYDGQCQRRRKLRGLCRQHAKIVAAREAKQRKGAADELAKG